MLSVFTVFLLLAPTFLNAAFPPIYVFRHGDVNDDSNLSELGIRRAKCYAQHVIKQLPAGVTNVTIRYSRDLLPISNRVVKTALTIRDVLKVTKGVQIEFCNESDYKCYFKHYATTIRAYVTVLRSGEIVRINDHFQSSIQNWRDPTKIFDQVVTLTPKLGTSGMTSSALPYQEKFTAACSTVCTNP